ncbi:MAG: SpoIIE family protein phosphatase [Ilumatobacteraceae bacterium]
MTVTSVDAVRPTPILDPARLAAVRATGLLDTPADEAFDRLTRLACQLLGAPFAFVTVVDETRSFWKSCIGVASDDPVDRQNMVEESFCQYVIQTDDALVVGDARLNPLTSSNPSIDSMGVLAWAGFPLRSIDGHVLGTFCVVDTITRDWTTDEVDVLRSLAGAVESEIRLRTLLAQSADNVERARVELVMRERLANLAERLAAADSTDAVADAITDLGPDTLGATVCNLVLCDSGHLTVRGSIVETEEMRPRYENVTLDDRLPVTDAIRTGQPVFITSRDDSRRRYPHMFDDFIAIGLSSSASVPLRHPDGTVLGGLTVGWSYARRTDGEDRAVLRTISVMCAQALQRARLGDVRRGLIEQLQCELLPAAPVVPGYDVAVRYLPATSELGFGGDWYDVIDLMDGRVIVIVGDIPGHGIEAAARMSQVRGAINALARIYGSDVVRVLRDAETMLAHLDEGYIATAVVMHIDPEAGRVTYVSAGHPPPLLVAPDGTVTLLTGGRRPLLGSGRDDPIVGDAPMPVGATVIAFTDGLVERRDQPSDVGTARVTAVIEGLRQRDPALVVDAILAEMIGNRSVGDDVALVAVRRDLGPTSAD